MERREEKREPAFLRQGDLLGTTFPGSAGALMFTSTFLVPPPLPPKNWPPNMKIAAATIIIKITNIATTAALLPPPLLSAIKSILLYALMIRIWSAL